MKIVLFPLYLLIVVYTYPANSPVDTHGRLKVQGIQLVSSIGQPVQLKGLSTHGPQWFPNCYNFASFQAQVQDWNANVIRIAMYVNEYGYNTNPTYWKTRVQEMIDWAGGLGVYVVVDWHVLNPGDPTDTTNNLGQDHILYEIANEPNGMNWSALSIYHTNMINLIRLRQSTFTPALQPDSCNNGSWNNVTTSGAWVKSKLM